MLESLDLLAKKDKNYKLGHDTADHSDSSVDVDLGSKLSDTDRSAIRNCGAVLLRSQTTQPREDNQSAPDIGKTRTTQRSRES